jgi:hypothetical protein
MRALAWALTVVAALRTPGPLSPRNANYRISATLDPASHTVRGREHLSWRNVASGAAHELVFHLYLNAFKNESSIFYRESHGHHHHTKADRHGWGAIDVTRLRVAGVDRTAALRVDDTLATVALLQPVAPGATVEIDVEFSATLPKILARTGYHDDFFAVAQWFPKIAVYDCAGGCRWRANQLHLNSEFFADYGVYDVELEVPRPFVVAATGVLTDEAARGDQKTLRYHAEDVHDFAWFASPLLERHEMRFSDELGALVVVLYAQPGHAASVPRHFAAAEAALGELDRRFGPYPYTQITLVDVPAGADGAGGMEYPTLIATESYPVPAGLHLAELTTIHELSHQYFYGIVGSDEAEEAWLDEGLTEAATDWGLSRRFGPAAALYELGSHRLSFDGLSRLFYRRVADLDAPSERSFDFLDQRSYGAISYAKLDLTLRTAEALLGPARFERALRRYFDTWRFGHPRRADFVRVFADEDPGLGALWTRALETSEVLDYQVLRVTADPVRPPAGLFDGASGRRESDPPRDPGARWRSEVIVHRAGQIAAPVELKVVFADGSVERAQWDDGLGAPPPGLRWHRFEFTGPQPVAWAEVDPDGKLALDVNRRNNGLRREADSGPRLRILSRYQRALSALLSLVGF